MSSNIIYTNIPEIISSCSSLRAQLEMIDTILINMLTAINNAAISGKFEEYKLDTGQTRNEVRYRSLEELQTAYGAMFKTKQMVLAQLNYNRTGRKFRLVNGNNFIPNIYWFR